METNHQQILPQSAKTILHPILERSPEVSWVKAETTRDQIYGWLLEECEREGVDALVLKSGPFVYPNWVKFECWIPKADRLLTERASAIITIEPKPFHQYELELTVGIENRGKTKTHYGLTRLDKMVAGLLVKYLLRGSSEPQFGDYKIRRYPWQIWKCNKVVALKTDWEARLCGALAIIGFMTIAFFGLGLILLIVSFIWGHQLSKRPLLVRSSGKPDGEPRNLVRVDSWQTVVSGLGRDSEVMRARFLQALDQPPIKGLRHRVERIWYWGLDSKEEREQIVLGLGRGLVFCQIYGYGEELFVGWDGCLNVGQWVEKNVSKGFDRKSNNLVQVNSVVPGIQQVSEYDVTDLSCVIEWSHAKLVDLLKKLMGERKIEQEVDFKIIRGDRQELTKTKEEKTKTIRTRFRGIRRTT